MGNWVSISEMHFDASLRSDIQTGTGARPGSYPTGPVFMEVKQLEHKAIYLLIPQRLGMLAAVVHTSTASYNFVMWCLIKQNNDCIYFLI
jgi:hypothetical protein